MFGRLVTSKTYDAAPWHEPARHPDSVLLAAVSHGSVVSSSIEVELFAAHPGGELLVHTSVCVSRGPDQITGDMTDLHTSLAQLEQTLGIPTPEGGQQ
jgi:hypothetical protein